MKQIVNQVILKDFRKFQIKQNEEANLNLIKNNEKSLA